MAHARPGRRYGHIHRVHGAKQGLLSGLHIQMQEDESEAQSKFRGRKKSHFLYLYGKQVSEG
ncbi:hypothetical protein AMTR_s00177p00052320 [Amborella trichopoda]|uniref:Uncharacterized protein n=1 Tax=Amborella trichopoda TaxID=13333 RepID=W1PK00_AMBTC|nr:hypothetical protein AMTR_s00177p00052320 [Amborella trichopoda]